MTAAVSVGDKYVSELKELFRARGVELYNGEHSLSLTSACLHYIERKLQALQDDSTRSRSQRLSDLQNIHDCLAKVKSLKLIYDRRNTVAPSLVDVDLSVFKATQCLVLRRIPICSVTNLQKLRQQLRVLVIQRSNLNGLEEVIVKCGKDNARAFVWSSLRELDLSFNYIKLLGESLQYLPEVESVNISNNHIGGSAVEIRSGVEISSGSSINSSDRLDGLEALAGVQYIDKVKTLHLGFNQLTCVPEFGGRAKYNLTKLILRNNLLKDIIGLEVLDCLIELDVCENLISKHAGLKPLLNLHHLSILSVMGNPVCYDPKYRLKLMSCLSNLVSPTSFELDEKKLSTTEKKAISRSATRYSPPTTPVITPSASPSIYHTEGVPRPTAPTPVSFSPIAIVTSRTSSASKNEEGSEDMKLQSLTSSSPKYSQQRRKSSVKKKPRVVVLNDNDTILDSSLSASLTSSNVPLLSEERLSKHNRLRTQLKDNWLSTADSFSTSGVAGEDEEKQSSDSVSPVTRPVTTTTSSTDNVKDEASQTHSYSANKRLSPVPVLTSSPTSTVQCNGREDPPTGGPPDARPTDTNSENDKRNRPFVSNGDPQQEGGVFLMEDESLSESPIDTGPVPQITGQIFDVSLLESDTDEEKPSVSDDGTWISISDRFFQEISISNNTVQDQLDLQCLKSASIEEKRIRGKKQLVLLLQFAYDRRDRRKREYILNDDSNEQRIMDLLQPIVDSNNSAVSIATKLECFKCQVVFDWSEALDAPQDSPAASAGFFSTSLDLNKRQFGKICPKCAGFLIQIGDGGTVGSLPFKTTSSSYHSSPSMITSRTNGVREGSVKLTSSEDLLSPGHIDLSQFASYPDAMQDSFERSDFHASVPPRLSPIPPSPFPDMSPFQTPQKPAPLGASRLSKNQDRGFIPEGEEEEEREETLSHLSFNGASARTSPHSEKTQEFGINSKPEIFFMLQPDSKPLLSTNPLYEDPDPPLPSTSPLSSLSSEQRVSVASSNPFDDLHDSEPEPRSDSRPGKTGSHTRGGERELVSERPNRSLSSKPVAVTSNASGLEEKVVASSVPGEGSKLKGYIATLRKGKEGEKNVKHKRSQSQDYKVPPLPNAIKERSLDKITGRGGGKSGSGHVTEMERQATGSGGEKKSSGSGSGGGKRHKGLFSVTSRKPKKSSRKSHSSSETEESKFVSSPVCPYKEDDPTYIHNSFQVHFNLEVFDTDRKEKFELAAKVPIIEYGNWNELEVESFIVISSLNAYIYRVTAPESLNPESWLELQKQLRLRDLIFIVIGVGYQSLRLEFDDPPQCYTLLLRNEDKSRKLFDKLSYIVSDVPKSKFRGVKISQLSLLSIKEPQRYLKQALLTDYDNFNDSVDKGDESSDEQVKIFLLVHKYTPQNDPALIPVTLLLTNQYLYLALDNPQWPLPKLHPLPDRSDLLPPYSGVMQKEITDVEKLILYDDQVCQFTLQFFNESQEKPPVSWTLISKTVKSVQKFVQMLEQLWMEEFQLTLNKEFR